MYSLRGCFKVVDIGPVAFYTLAFAGTSIGGYVVANFMTRGLAWNMTKVRAFGRPKGWVLIKVHTVSRPYYKVGKLKGSVVTYTPRNGKDENGNKIVKAIVVQKGCIENNMGVDYLEVDEETNNVLNISNWKVVTGHDAETVSSLLTRIAMLPKNVSKQQIIVLVLCVLILLVCGFTAWKLGQVQGLVEALQASQEAARVIPADVGNVA